MFRGRGRLLERPLEPYFELFREAGVCYGAEDGALTVNGRLKPGVYYLPGNVSSQFITGLLYALPLLDGDSELRLTTDLESRGYIDMTLQALAQFGVAAEYDGARAFRVQGSQRFSCRDVAVEGDWSQAAFWLAANAAGSQVELYGMNPQSAQGDRTALYGFACLRGEEEAVLDLSQCPDLAPPLAACAALRPGLETRLVNAGRLRMKESDRLASITQVLRAMGAQVEEGPDSLTIVGRETLPGGVTVDSHNDHRIAMMAAIAAIRCEKPVTVAGAQCVAKSYPGFWEDYEKLGGVIRREEHV